MWGTTRRKWKDKEELKEKVEDLQGTVLDQNLDAAVKLGLFEEIEGEYRPTTNGKKLGYNRLSETEESELFKELVRDYQFYNKLLEIVGGDLTSEDDEQYLDRDRVQSAIGINFDFGVQDRTLKSISGTFLKVLEKCGVGQYIQGRRGFPTRLVVNEEYSEFLSQISSEEDTSEPSEGAESTQNETLTAEHLDSAESSDEITAEDGGKVEPQEEDSESEAERVDNKSELSKVELARQIETNGSVDLDISIEISSEDWDSNSVVELIKAIQSIE